MSVTHVADAVRREEWPAEFRPNRSPEQMIRAGIFGGVYFGAPQLIDPAEFPASWFAGLDRGAYARAGIGDPAINRYGVRAGRFQRFWEERGWIHPDDPRGWVQWYCRYYLGRRHEDDDRQIDRWVRFADPVHGRWTLTLFRAIRDAGGEEHLRDAEVRPVVRQSLLQWAYEPMVADYRRWAAQSA